MTLKFLGDTDEGLVPEILAVLRDRTIGVRTFGITIGGFGMFPSRRRPRVLWIGCDDPGDKLVAIRAGLVRDMDRLGFPRDDRPFHPHFTVGRMPAEGVAHYLTSLPKNITFEPHHTAVSEIFLMKSVLKPAGSEYSALGSVTLT